MKAKNQQPPGATLCILLTLGILLNACAASSPPEAQVVELSGTAATPDPTEAPPRTPVPSGPLPATSASELCASVTPRPIHTMSRRSTTARNVEYDAETNTILVRKGAPVTLATVGRTLDRPELLQEAAPGEWLLSANLQIEKGATLRIAAPEVRRLKLRSDAGGFVWIKAVGGRLEFVDTCITSWDSRRSSVDAHYADGRSFVLARSGAWMSIRGSELSYLGYDEYESYGVAWRQEGTRGEIINSRLGYNYYGLYSYEVSELVILDNEVHHSIQYGIDPHTRSHRLRIENNLAHHNGKHGIILAEECTESVIRSNTVFYNNAHGIVLYQESNGNLVERNVVFGNRMQGMNVNDSSHNTLRRNTVYDNLEDGIGVGQDARGNVITHNEVRNNRRHGIYLFSDAEDNTLSDNTVHGNERYGIYIKSENNQITEGNTVFDNTVGIYLNVDDPPEVSQEDNHIYGNREANLLTSADS